MTPIGPLITHEESRLRMVAVHHAWAMMYRRECNDAKAAVQLHAAREMLEEARRYGMIIQRRRCLKGKR